MEKDMIYSTKQDYIGRVVVPALGGFADEFDADEIADDMLVWHNGADLNENGFVEDEAKDFWEVVENIGSRQDRAV